MFPPTNSYHSTKLVNGQIAPCRETSLVVITACLYDSLAAARGPPGAGNSYASVVYYVKEYAILESRFSDQVVNCPVKSAGYRSGKVIRPFLRDEIVLQGNIPILESWG